jgi:hypothetical protein
MTVVATSPRRLAVSHAFAVPVVREVQPPRSAPASGVW